ncbi:MAG: carbamoyl phosphate synthase large subunit, partial [Nitrospirae bacterium]|nr:carbamoyl phosphate synthase large subunit [Nitrospirota bacterium]
QERPGAVKNQERPGAVKNEVWILEVNPRASRTIPYVSKATGVPLAKMAAMLMVGKTIKELGIDRERVLHHVAVKESVFPFDRFSGVDILLGPEMKSTGEVMGIDSNFGLAYAKAQASSCNSIPLSGKIFISVRDRDKAAILEIARALVVNGFSLIATCGTAAYLASDGLEVEVINKVVEGRPHIVDSIKNKDISYIINTVSGAQAKADSHSIRTAALQYKVPYSTTVAGARALVNAIEMLKSKTKGIKTIQDYHKDIQVG